MFYLCGLFNKSCSQTTGISKIQAQDQKAVYLLSAIEGIYIKYGKTFRWSTIIYLTWLLVVVVSLML